MGCCSSGPTSDQAEKVDAPTKPQGGTLPIQRAFSGRPPSEKSIVRARTGAIQKPLLETPPSQALGAHRERPTLLKAFRTGTATARDVWMQAIFAKQLKDLARKHPYLQPGNSVQPHPLEIAMSRCRECSTAKKFGQAQRHLHSVRFGLQAEVKPIAETFRRFATTGSGHLEAPEFRHICAYYGWVEDGTLDMMDLDRDGKVTLEDMQSFVGYLGGTRRLFEKRRLRITASRRDVDDIAGIAVGAHVRAYFYVKGQKSQLWKEAQVVSVGIQLGPAKHGVGQMGVGLEYCFGPGKRWRSKQVVPASWVIGTIEDTSVAVVLNEVGILDEQQAYWTMLMPETEMYAMRRLVPCQRDALRQVTETATKRHDEAMAPLLERFKKLDYGVHELRTVLDWVQDLAPIVVHIKIDNMGEFLETDEFYRNQFETKTSNGSYDDSHSARQGWERALFGGAYETCKPFERCKYGALNIMNDYRGVKSASQYGDSYLVLKDVRLRATFTHTDSSRCDIEDMAVLGKYAHVLLKYDDRELRHITQVATAAVATESELGHLQAGGELQLLRGTSEDPTSDWVTFGFPKSHQSEGCYYFEVQLFQECRAPQVGLLSSKFQCSPLVASTTGVGDDEHGWAADGQNSALWHGGTDRAWSVSWPSSDGGLAQDLVLGVAVDFKRRRIWFSSDGVWDDSSGFGPDDIPKGAALYPALSFQGRAAFHFRAFKHSPPSFDGGAFSQWPGMPGGSLRVDCPLVGDSTRSNIYKEIQVHGEVSLKRNVQRLVANDKYRRKPKTLRSYGLKVTGAAVCCGSYKRKGVHGGMPLYKSEEGSVIYFDAESKLWKLNGTEDFKDFIVSAPCAASASLQTGPPREGWKARDRMYGVVSVEVFEEALRGCKLGDGDIKRLTSALTVSDEGGDKIYRVKGGTSLGQEWAKLAAPPQSAEDAWSAAVAAAQKHVLRSLGIPDECRIVETEHPYRAIRAEWTQEVTFEGAGDMKVYFSPECQTYDSCAAFSIEVDGLREQAAGPGARMEVFAHEGAVWGTVVERKEGVWKVRLDRRPPPTPPDAPARGAKRSNKIAGAASQSQGFLREPAPEAPAWAVVGGEVEGLFENGMWYKATIRECREGPPSTYVIDWYDGDERDREKTLEQLRERWDVEATGADLDDLPRYSGVPRGGGACFAYCAEEPKVVVVSYSGSVGEEITAFGLDTQCPLTPIRISGFSESGPAHDQGVRGDWFLDVISTATGSSRTSFAKLLEGIGGVSLEGINREGDEDEGKLNLRMSEMLDAAFKEPEELLKRINGSLQSLRDVKMVFTNSSSHQRVKLMPHAYAAYGPSERVGGEVKTFTVEGSAVKVEQFSKWGPAQEAGVSKFWILDIAKTQAENPSKADSLGEAQLMENPNVLTALSGVTLVFRHPTPDKVTIFSGYGTGPWECDSIPSHAVKASFHTDGDGRPFPQRRWGIWALFVPGDAPALPADTQQKLFEQYNKAGAEARGISDDDKVRVIPDDWCEARLRALCEKHGWEFSWMTEDGERSRRIRERDAFVREGGVVAKVGMLASRSREAMGREDGAGGAAVQASERQISVTSC